MDSESAAVNGYCRACDYPLGGVEPPKCPECGRAFDPADPATVSARPAARRRRWARRVMLLAGVFALWCVFGPSRVARFTWTWPSENGKTATSETRWHVLGPRWLGMTYAKVTTRRWKHPMPSGYLTVADYKIWRVGVFSTALIDGISADRPPSELPNNFGALAFQPSSLGRGDPIPPPHFVDIRPGNFDALAEIVFFANRKLANSWWTPHVLKEYPPEAKEK